MNGGTRGKASQRTDACAKSFPGPPTPNLSARRNGAITASKEKKLSTFTNRDGGITIKNEFTHHDHGNEMHNLLIMVAKWASIKKGYTILDPRGIKDKGIFPGEPDLMIRVDYKGGWNRYIIEVETNPSSASITKKTNQFTSDGITELLIWDVRTLTKGRDYKEVTLGEMFDWVERGLP
jgi:hypothetical protein